MTFDKYVQRVDTLFILRVGASLHDMPDLPGLWDAVREGFEGDIPVIDTLETVAEILAEDDSLFADVWYG